MHLIRLFALSALFAVVAIQPAGSDEPERSKVAPRKILFDTDPGGDDTFALLWLQSLARQRQAEIVAVTTVAGNVGARQTFLNASRVLSLGGHPDVEIGRSAIGGDESVDAAHIHGSDGMGDLSAKLPAANHRWQTARQSDDVIIDKLRSNPGEIVLVAVGPLTNLAAAQRKSPGVLREAKELVVMGGAFLRRGNITPQAEFNIYCDPEAAEVVFASRDDVVVLPLDVTTQINFHPRHSAAILAKATDNSAADFLAGLAEYLTTTSQGFRETEGAACFHVHDAATLAYLFHPQTLLMRRALVRVETKGRWTRGQTIFDQRHGAKLTANAWVAQEVDAENLLAIMVEDFKVLCSR